MSDPISPNHYQMPDGTQVLQISRHLSSNGGQAVQYIARATRTDGNNKGDRVEDLRKSIVFIEDEIHRLQALGAEKATEPRVWTSTADMPTGVLATDRAKVEFCNTGMTIEWRKPGWGNWETYAVLGENVDIWDSIDKARGPFTEVV